MGYGNGNFATHATSTNHEIAITVTHFNIIFFLNVADMTSGDQKGIFEKFFELERKEG